MDKELPEELEGAEGAEVIVEGAEVIVEESELVEYAKTEGLLDDCFEAEAVSAEEEASVPTRLAEMPEERQSEIMAEMETVLFMSDRPVGLPRLRAIIDRETPLSVFRALMVRLREDFARDHRGVEIGEVSLGFQLRTKPHMSAVLRKMVKTQPLKLTGPNMECLAVVAYKQPVTKDELDRIRGVDSGYILRALMEKRLIRIVGRSDLPGRPMLYGTTHEFLELFSLRDLTGLPPLHEVESMVAASEVGADEDEKRALEVFGQMVVNQTQVLFDDSKLDGELEEIRAQIASVPTSTPYIDEQKRAEKLAAAQPSPELMAAAEAAQAERHAEMIAQAHADVVSTDAHEQTAVPAAGSEGTPAENTRPSGDSLPA